MPSSNLRILELVSRPTPSEWTRGSKAAERELPMRTDNESRIVQHDNATVRTVPRWPVHLSNTSSLMLDLFLQKIWMTIAAAVVSRWQSLRVIVIRLFNVEHVWLFAAAWIASRLSNTTLASLLHSDIDCRIGSAVQSSAAIRQVACLFAISLSKKVATNESTLFCERSFLIDTNRAANNIAIYVFI